MGISLKKYYLNFIQIFMFIYHGNHLSVAAFAVLFKLKMPRFCDENPLLYKDLSWYRCVAEKDCMWESFPAKHSRTNKEVNPHKHRNRHKKSKQPTSHTLLQKGISSGCPAAPSATQREGRAGRLQCRCLLSYFIFTALH